MAKTKLAKKRRLLRAHAHQSLTRPSWVPFPEKEPLAYEQLPAEQQVTPEQLEKGGYLEAPAEQPTRAKCRHCSKSQKVRKDGTFGAHGGCRGDGHRWDAQD